MFRRLRRTGSDSRCVHWGMGVLAAAAANGGTTLPTPATGLGPALALLAAALFLLGLLGLGAIVLFRWRHRPARPQREEDCEIPDAWVEAGRRLQAGKSSDQ